MSTFTNHTPPHTNQTGSDASPNHLSGRLPAGDPVVDARIVFPDIEPLSDIVDGWLCRNLGWFYGQLDDQRQP